MLTPDHSKDSPGEASGPGGSGPRASARDAAWASALQARQTGRLTGDLKSVKLIRQGRGRTMRGTTILRLLSWVASVANAGGAGPAAAQVLEIQPDGAVVTYSGPGVYSSEGVRSLLQQ